jgi:pimeloyl-ACP methyl ester carboxylesterase
MSAYVRLGLQLLSRAQPRLAAWWAERLFFTPPRARARSGRIESFLATGEAFTVSTPQGPIAAWRWGSGPAVLLVHGWGGRGGQLAEFAPPLLAAGFSVVTFDGPGHGHTGHGLSSLVDIGRALQAVADAVAPVHGAITHSVGGAAVTFALRHGLTLPRAVFICPPARPARWVDDFAARFDVPARVVALLRARTERRLAVPWSELDLPSLVGELPTELLVLHDRDDEEVPSSDGALLAERWPGARMVTTQGLGHRRILRDPQVVAHAVEFLAAGDPPPAQLTEAHRLEAELFDREQRPRWADEVRTGAAASRLPPPPRSPGRGV